MRDKFAGEIEKGASYQLVFTFVIAVIGFIVVIAPMLEGAHFLIALPVMALYILVFLYIALSKFFKSSDNAREIKEGRKDNY
jgi:cytochrome c-type biogenesis protein CcmH/NrfF